MQTLQDWVDFMEMQDDRTTASVPDWLMPHLPLEMLEGDRLHPDFADWKTPLETARVFLFVTRCDLDVPWTGTTYPVFKQLWDQRDILTMPPDPQPIDGVGADLYFIGAEGGPIKIGVSQNPAKRLKQLQTSNPSRLAILAIVKGAAHREPEYHRRFARWRLAGEWFTRCPEILAEIDRLSPPKPGVLRGVGV